MKNTRQYLLSHWARAISLALGLVFAHASSALADQIESQVANKAPCQKCHQNYKGKLSPEQVASLDALKTQKTELQGKTESTLLQGSTGSTLLQTGTSSTLLQSGTTSTTLQTGTSSTTLQTGTEQINLQGGTDSTVLQGNLAEEAAVNVLILLDSSQTMKEGLHGVVTDQEENKLTVAKQVISDVLKEIPDDVNVGLRVFGNAFKNDSNWDCRQSFLLVPIGQRNRRYIAESVEDLQPRGMTPLAYTLVQAAQDFRGHPGVRRIILVSDGFETCGGDPCLYIKRLSQLGYDMKIDIVGVGLKRDKIAKAHLSCLSDSSGGHYYEADTTGEMIDSLKNSFNEAIADAKVNARLIEGPKGLSAGQALRILDQLTPQKKR